MHEGVEILPHPAALAARAADIFLGRAKDVLQRRNLFTMALAGGTTPLTLYQLLTSEPYRGRVPWQAIQFFFGDERGVPPDHPDSNFAAANRVLFVPLKIPPHQIHRMRGEMPNLDDAADQYAQELRPLVEHEFPRLDLVLLGLGPDGHTASLFPHSWGLAEQARWVVSIEDAPKPPPRRLTLTVPVLNAAAQIMVLVAGAEKAEAVREVLQGEQSAAQWPAKLIRRDPEHVRWLVDETAASRLKH